MLLQLSQLSPFAPLCLELPSIQQYPTYFMSMGHAYKFFGFSISYTILNLPLSMLYLPFMLLIPYPFSPILPLPPLRQLSTTESKTS